MWSCQTCTLENERDALACAVCFTARSSGASRTSRNAPPPMRDDWVESQYVVKGMTEEEQLEAAIEQSRRAHHTAQERNQLKVILTDETSTNCPTEHQLMQDSEQTMLTKQSRASSVLDSFNRIGLQRADSELVSLNTTANLSSSRCAMQTCEFMLPPTYTDHCVSL